MSGAVLIVGISTITFWLLALGAGDVGRQRLGVTATQEQVDQLNEELGRNDPIIVQFTSWASKAVRGDFGDSWFSSQSVSELLKQRAPITLTLILASLFVASLLAIVLGILSAVRGGVIDRLVQAVGVIGFAIPGFLIAFGLVVWLAIDNKIFRATGYTKPSEDLGEWLRSVTLPVIALVFGSLAALSLQIRGAVRDTLDLDFVRTLRSRGLSERRVVYKHVLRNSAGPALSVLGVTFIGLFGGAVIIERIFAIQGLGLTAVDSASNGDVPVVMGLVVFTAVMVVIANLIVDLISAWLNPKVRLS
jgi:peptide/nickel transport system permease protein